MRWISPNVGLNATLKLEEKERKLVALVKNKGYIHGTKIMYDSNVLTVGYGMCWSEYQQAIVVGCSGPDGYYTAVPIHKPSTNWWAKIAE